MVALMNTEDFVAMIAILIVLLVGIAALHVIINNKNK
tara:strand:+ start:249 stop:359 length:111 start_codon:yes stop_codon:yes gene_type:complete